MCAMKVNFCFELNEAEIVKWNDFWHRCRHAHPRQQFLFGKIERAKGLTPVYVYGEAGGSIVCAGIFCVHPLFAGKHLSLEAVCLRGPAFDDISYGEYYIREAISWFTSLHVGRLRISPYWYFPEAEPIASLFEEIGFVPYDGDRSASTGLLDLTRSESDILASFDRKTRQQIKAAAKLGISIVPATDIDEATLALSCLSSMRRQRGLTPMSENEFAAIFEYVLKGQDKGLLLNAKLGTTLLGTLWNFRARDYSNPAGYAIVPHTSRDLPSSFSIGPVLWWEMMKWAKSRGCRWFDVEGYVENPDPSSRTYEVHRFKRRFNPQPVELMNEHTIVCNKAMHFLSQQYGYLIRLPRAIASVPYRVRAHFKGRERKKVMASRGEQKH